jgi:hypothetical protein
MSSEYKAVTSGAAAASSPVKPRKSMAIWSPLYVELRHGGRLDFKFHAPRAHGRPISGKTARPIFGEDDIPARRQRHEPVVEKQCALALLVRRDGEPRTDPSIRLRQRDRPRHGLAFGVEDGKRKSIVHAGRLGAGERGIIVVAAVEDFQRDRDGLADFENFLVEPHADVEARSGRPGIAQRTGCEQDKPGQQKRLK